MNSSDNTSSPTSKGVSQAEAAAGPVAAVLRRSATPGNNNEDAVSPKRPELDDTEESHSSSSSSSSAPISARGDPVPDLLSKVERAAESTTPSYLASYVGRLNDAPRRGSYRKSTEIGQLKYAADFLQDLSLGMINNE